MSYLRLVGQEGYVDLSQGLHGFGGARLGQQSKQGVWNGCREPQKGSGAITKTVLASWPGHNLLTVSEEDVSCSVPWGPGVSEVLNQTLHRLKQDKIRFDCFNVKRRKKS